MSPQVAVLIQVYSITRSLLMMESSRVSVSMLRAFDDAFFSVKTIDEFIGKFNADYIDEKKVNKNTRYNYLKGYVERGISVNTSLFGGFEDSGDNTIHYAIAAKSVHEINVVEIMKSVLANLWQVSPDSAEVISKAQQYQSIIKECANTKGGCLFQIIIKPEVVDDLVYIAETYGKPLELDMKGNGITTHKPSEIIPLMRNDPEEFEKKIKENAAQFETTDLSRRQYTPTLFRLEYS